VRPHAERSTGHFTLKVEKVIGGSSQYAHPI
jgi:hypothetical protein